MPSDELKAIADALAEPFPPDHVGWKPQMVKQNRCLAAAYIDARDVAERLDAVLGPDGWESEMTPLPDGKFLCRLTLHFPSGRSATRSDVGGESDQPDPGDKAKAAVSDALKRAAVQFGVGRYLYRLPASWVDFDPVKRQIVAPPRLPDWALPLSMRGKPAPAAARTTTAADTAPQLAGPTKEEVAAFAALAKRKGQSWANCMAWLNRATGTRQYTEQTRASEVGAEPWRKLVAAVESMPDQE